DLARFKALTLGGTLLMGRRTAESLGRALPRRRNLVLTRGGRVPWPGMEAVASLDEARARAAGEDVLWAIGRGEVYALALPSASALYLTRADAEAARAHAPFPAFDPAGRRQVPRGQQPPDARRPLAFEFIEYRRPSAARRRVPRSAGPRYLTAGHLHHAQLLGVQPQGREAAAPHRARVQRVHA